MKIQSRKLYVAVRYKTSFISPLKHTTQKHIWKAPLIPLRVQRLSAQVNIDDYAHTTRHVYFAHLPTLLYLSLSSVAHRFIVVVLGITQLLGMEEAQKGRSSWQTQAYLTT